MGAKATSLARDTGNFVYNKGKPVAIINGWMSFIALAIGYYFVNKIEPVSSGDFFKDVENKKSKKMMTTILKAMTFLSLVHAVVGTIYPDYALFSIFTNEN
tara:strand:+ start:65 stop:367 length:303 start_codon:yes stop_codon:yes gene_type:complete